VDILHVSRLTALKVDKNLVGSSRKFWAISSHSLVFYPMAFVSLAAVAHTRSLSEASYFRRAHAQTADVEAR